MPYPKDPNNYRIVNYTSHGPSTRQVGSDLPYCAAGPNAGVHFRLPYGTSCSDKAFNSLDEAISGCAARTKDPLVGPMHDCAWKGGDGSRSRDGKKWLCGDGRHCRDH
jgi:hypothetical protein